MKPLIISLPCSLRENITHHFQKLPRYILPTAEIMILYHQAAVYQILFKALPFMTKVITHKNPLLSQIMSKN